MKLLALLLLGGEPISVPANGGRGPALSSGGSEVGAQSYSSHKNKRGGERITKQGQGKPLKVLAYWLCSGCAPSPGVFLTSGTAGHTPSPGCSIIAMKTAEEALTTPPKALRGQWINCSKG